MFVRLVARVLAGGALCFGGLCASALAAPQEPFDDGGMVIIDGGGMIISGAQGPEAGAPAAAGKPSPRLEKLKKLEFDRRPSAMLAAWSTPPKTEDAKSDAAKTESKAEVKTEAKPEAAPAADAAAKPEAAPLDPAAAAKAAAAAEANAKAEAEAAAKAAEAKAIDAEMLALQRNVTLGDWAAVKTYFDGLTDDEHKGGYARMLQSLQNGPQQRVQVPQAWQPYVEKNAFAPADVVGLAGAALKEPSKENLAALGAILRQALDSGHQLETFLAQVRPHLEEAGYALNRRHLAQLLANAGRPRNLEGLLPTIEDAQRDNDREGLNLLSRYFLAQYDAEKKVTWLEQAWTATQAVLAVGDVEATEKVEALKRAVDIAPKIREQLGAAWLDESFTRRPERGMEILAAIGSASSTTLAMEPMDTDKREKLLQLQSTAAKALLAAAPQLADQWHDQLGVLASNWLREALFTYQNDTSTSFGPRQQRDRYGNFFYYDYSNSWRGNMPTPITTTKMLEARPSDEWLNHIDPTLMPRFDMLFAQLFLKVGEEAQAFPYIERLAPNLPQQAEGLVAEFLRVWTRNHDPNEARRNQNEYVFYYGFEERANGIPLTRSKQDRNLRELGEWVTRLRGLKVKVDDALLAQAFTTAHSSAEVFRLETIEQIFGSLDLLEPKMLAELVQQMRLNLVTVWRDPAVQKDKKTNRRPQDIQAEVLHGYELAHATLQRALVNHENSWELWLAQAAIEHDEANYQAEIAKSSGFSAQRDAAFATFSKAAQLYTAGVEALDEEKESAQVFEMWFYAALGACDLKAIDARQLLAEGEIPRIRAALEKLPGERAERHRAMIASNLFARMSSASPAIKFRYVKQGLAIVGDHKLAREAKGVFDYYSDLVTEIQLRTSIDGSDRVGHDHPFGLRVDLRHTREIERESGGFSKYLQNQNAQTFAYNYGRPTEDYRDRFEETARKTLEEHFEVLSVTFNHPEVKSKADAEYGWRRTPYAYLLLKPRGPQVDRVPALHLDLDFLDTSGYAVIPVESPALVIDASDAAGDERPFSKLALTQTLE